jgi:hypothetical protein
MSDTPNTIPTILPLSECTPEVLKAAAQTAFEWARLVASGVAGDAARTPTTPISKQAMELVHRMRGCAEFKEKIEASADIAHRMNKEPEDFVADAIFWFIQGWFAAATAIEQKEPV